MMMRIVLVSILNTGTCTICIFLMPVFEKQEIERLLIKFTNINFIIKKNKIFAGFKFFLKFQYTLKLGSHYCKSGY